MPLIIRNGIHCRKPCRRLALKVVSSQKRRNKSEGLETVVNYQLKNILDSVQRHDQTGREMVDIIQYITRKLCPILPEVDALADKSEDAKRYTPALYEITTA